MYRDNFLHSWEKLTPREQYTVHLMASGMTEVEIADHEGVSVASIKKRKARIYRKFWSDYLMPPKDRHKLVAEAYNRIIGGK